MPPAIAPPRDAEDALIWLQLFRSPRVGPKTFFRLLDECGSADAAREALPDIAETAGLKKYELAQMDAVRREYEAGVRFGASLIAYGSSAYPLHLMDVDDAPPLIWASGDVQLLRRASVAIVGSRNASSLGQRMTRALAKKLGEAEKAIVSGLARGIDATAHEAALPTGTIAVVAGGVDVVYPIENRDLTAKIHRQGVIISEQPMGLKPQARHFPRRNRLISGTAQALVVVEAAAKSGSLITARDALDQGREVLAVPGHPFDARAAGSNALIRDGATLVRGADDILEALERPSPHPTQSSDTVVKLNDRRSEQPADDLRDRILGHLGHAPLAEDQLIRDLELPAAEVTASLTEMEIAGDIVRASGGLLSLRA